MEESRPKVSVLIPVYNVEKYLGRCLDSVLGQSLKDIEVVCVDDASPDGSAEILREYAARDPRVKIITKQRNEGLMMARKTGYQNAEGEYFLFCDSDDYLADGALEHLYNAAKAADADIAPADFYFETPAGRRTRASRTAALTTDPRSYQLAIMNGTLCTIWGSLFHRRLFEGREYVTFMNHSFGEDRVLLSQLLAVSHRIEPVAFPSYVYFRNSGAMTRNRLSDRQLGQVIKALDWTRHFLSYDPEYSRAATRHYSRYLSFLIESGYSTEFIKNFTPDNPALLQFGTLRRNIGTRLACHTWACIHLPLYRPSAALSRRMIQRILGR